MTQNKNRRGRRKATFDRTDLLLPFQVGEFRLSRFSISMSAGIRSLTDLVRHGTNGDVPYGAAYVFVNDTKTIASIFAYDALATTVIFAIVQFAYDALGNSRFITKWYPIRPGAKFDVDKYLPKGRKAPSAFVSLTEDQFRDLLSKHVLPSPIVKVAK